MGLPLVRREVMMMTTERTDRNVQHVKELCEKLDSMRSSEPHIIENLLRAYSGSFLPVTKEFKIIEAGIGRFRSMEKPVAGTGVSEDVQLIIDSLSSRITG